MSGPIRTALANLLAAANAGGVTLHDDIRQAVIHPDFYLDVAIVA
jgi:hypothetical protein